MRTRLSPGRERNAVEAAVAVRRPVRDVFDFYRDFRNLPRFLGDVMDVEVTDAGGTAPLRSRWTIQGPKGLSIHWTVEVTEERPEELISYETVSGPPGVRSRWDIHFSRGDEPDTTVVREVMGLPFGRVGRRALSLVGKPPGAEAEANLHRLKQLLETGEVTDTAHAVPGKFDRPGP
ncbi:SRPBCC family protein [Streptomyces sp. TS71-3]|uniref:SRPBCC family protein n=1 Tax=Streptomyces sp. TS71-3 TaxID=2733862 RepID=UPI001BB344D1|nr:SRPBCC family protein [Streptomyces sp. TS71-3]